MRLRSAVQPPMRGATVPLFAGGTTVISTGAASAERRTNSRQSVVSPADPPDQRVTDRQRENGEDDHRDGEGRCRSGSSRARHLAALRSGQARRAPSPLSAAPLFGYVPSMSARPIHPILKIVLEFGPLAVFFLTYRAYSGEEVALFGEVYEGVVVATIAFIPAILTTLAISWALTRDLPRMAVVTAVVVVIFGGLTIWLNDATFIKMKPTIVNLIFAFILGWGLLRGRSYLKYLMGEFLPLTDEGWMIFTRRWALFFLFMAALNEVIWRTQSEDFWVNFKTFGSPAVTLVFMVAQAGLLKRHAPPEG